jgi:predicted RNase H-like HicB family nuclease
MLFHVRMEQAEDGWFTIECPALPGCISQGKDEQDALTNIKEAIAAWLWTADVQATKKLPEGRRSLIVIV